MIAFCPIVCTGGKGGGCGARVTVQTPKEPKTDLACPTMDAS